MQEFVNGSNSVESSSVASLFFASIIMFLTQYKICPWNVLYLSVNNKVILFLKWLYFHSCIDWRTLTDYHILIKGLQVSLVILWVYVPRITFELQNCELQVTLLSPSMYLCSKKIPKSWDNRIKNFELNPEFADGETRGPSVLFTFDLSILYL